MIRPLSFDPPSDEQVDYDRPVLGPSTSLGRAMNGYPSAASSSTGPAHRRSIYPAPVVAPPQDVKADVKPKTKSTGSVLRDINRIDVGPSVNGGGGGGGARRSLASGGDRRQSGGQDADYDVKPDVGEMSYQDKLKVKQELAGRAHDKDEEIKSVEDQIASLSTLLATLKRERAELDRSSSRPSASSSAQSHLQPQAPGKNGGIDYLASDYEWSAHMKKEMRQTFGIDNYRLCQEGVCNANMDSRDIICIMPTGGGKSLTYQLPAILSPGTTIVISPLLSLIADQLIHLHENDISSVMLTGAVPKGEQSAITSRMVQGPSRGAGAGAGRAALAGEDGREIKLVYVTPEKISKSKHFTSVLQKMYAQGRLARFVIDEAHCVSQLGHDYRPDYKKLSILRTLFPKVPIMAVTATCSRKVLPDLLQTLQMSAITPSDDADPKGTVFFDAPLYRKNLHYKVLSKPSGSKEALAALADYITDNHANESGIVYCLSKKDAETVAEGLLTHSKGLIKTGVYHADVEDSEKQRLHHRWRDGEVNVVVATIAFGLGIDKGNVRFVLHHSMSKSLDGYYQETGRAGRDGEDASCVLFYRAQDASRMSGMICGELEGVSKLREMVAYAQDLNTCRKILFGRYFSTSASLPSKSWAEKEERCGHCDNCTRDPNSVEQKDVTVQAWKVCKVSQWVQAQAGRLTVSALGDLVRGLGGGAFSVVQKGKGKSKKRKQSGEKDHIDLDDLCGGKSDLNKDAIESLIMHLLLQDYLAEDYQVTAYATNVYIVPGPSSIRLSRFSRDDIDSGVGMGPPIIKSFPVKTRKSKAKTPTKVKAEGTSKGKGNAKVADSDSDDDQGEPIEDDEEEDPYGGAEDDYNHFSARFADDENGDDGDDDPDAAMEMDDDDADVYAQLAAAGQEHLLDRPPPKKKAKPKPSQPKPKPKPKSKPLPKPKPRKKARESSEDEDEWDSFADAHGNAEGGWETVVVAPRAGMGSGGGSGRKVTGGGRVVSGSMGSGLGSGDVPKRRRVDDDEGGGRPRGSGEMIELSSD